MCLCVGMYIMSTVPEAAREGIIRTSGAGVSDGY